MKTKFFLLIFAFIGLSSCKTKQLIYSSTPENKLFKVVVLYPNGEGKTFDLAYYESTHMPMVADFLGENLNFYEIDKGIAGRTRDDEVPYLAVGYFYVKDLAEYEKAIGQNIDTIISDIKNYTNIQPIVQISEVKYIGFNDVK